MKKVDVKTHLSYENYKEIEEWCEENGSSMSGFLRYGAHLAMQETGGMTEFMEVAGLEERLRNIERDHKPEMVRSEAMQDVWSDLKDNLQKDVSPSVEVFDDLMDIHTKKAQEVNSADDTFNYKEVSKFANWCKLIYKMCHPEHGPEKRMLANIFYHVEARHVPGKTETGDLAFDVLRRYGKIPEYALIDAWRQGTRLARHEEWSDEWRDKVGVRLE